MKDHKLYDMRKEYSQGPLEIFHLNWNPFVQFDNWFSEALTHENSEPNAMALATAGKNLMPSVRMVLLKSYSQDGFVFFTNYLSKKGRQLTENNRAAMLFFWPVTMRQVRIEGCVEKIKSYDSDEYFLTRPPRSRASAILSRQSTPLEDKSSFESEIDRLVQKGDILTRPANWGGYLLRPGLFEFWQGATDRIHDRFQYIPDGKKWKISRLYP